MGLRWTIRRRQSSNSWHGRANQLWTLQPIADDFVRLISRQSGKALDVSGASLEDGGAVVQFMSHEGTNQQWRLRPVQSPMPSRPVSTTAGALNRRRGRAGNGVTRSILPRRSARADIACPLSLRCDLGDGMRRRRREGCHRPRLIVGLFFTIGCKIVAVDGGLRLQALSGSARGAEVPALSEYGDSVRRKAVDQASAARGHQVLLRAPLGRMRRVPWRSGLAEREAIVMPQHRALVAGAARPVLARHRRRPALGRRAGQDVVPVRRALRVDLAALLVERRVVVDVRLVGVQLGDVGGDEHTLGVVPGTRFRSDRVRACRDRWCSDTLATSGFPLRSSPRAPDSACRHRPVLRDCRPCRSRRCSRRSPWAGFALMPARSGPRTPQSRRASESSALVSPPAEIPILASRPTMPSRASGTPCQKALVARSSRAAVAGFPPARRTGNRLTAALGNR